MPLTNREVDAAVAEKVFGWQWVVNIAQNFTHQPDWVKACDGCRFLRGHEFRPHELQVIATGAEPVAPEGPYTAIYPHYSTDPVASKALRDRMRELGWRYEIWTTREGRFAASFLRDCVDDEAFEESFTGEADTEEMAVVLAALSAFGIEVPA